MTMVPVCPRCAGTRHLHVTRVVDETPLPFDATHLEQQIAGSPLAPGWRLRPVGLVPTQKLGSLRFRSEPVEPVGHFETIVCRRCGFTSWYAKAWESLVSAPSKARCRDCDAQTDHVVRDAVEGGGIGYEVVRLTHGMVGREGFVDLSICVPCGRTTWRARDYRHLEDRVGAPYRHADEPERPCLECGATKVLFIARAREHDPQRTVAVTTHHRKLFGLLPWESAEGGFSLRTCLSCDTVEWYATKLDQVKVAAEDGVFALGDEPSASMGGPYR